MFRTNVLIISINGCFNKPAQARASFKDTICCSAFEEKYRLQTHMTQHNDTQVYRTKDVITFILF